MTETERIVRRVEAYAPMPDEEIYADFIRGFLRGKKRAQMLTGQRYYENRGDILRREKMVLGADGKWVPDEGAQVSRIAHGFVRKLVDQKALQRGGQQGDRLAAGLAGGRGSSF